ncbi:MAG TPA: VOC family protein [Actinomycetes bacterium]|nr:VOC family protein [Actinomycetes bacterium]
MGVEYLAFGRVPDPSPGKNKVHLDLATADRPGEVARPLALGATVVAEHQVPGLEWTVLADSEGNHFCVAQHG